MRPGSRSWKLADLEILRALVARGRSPESIAWVLGRTPGAVMKKLYALGWHPRRNRRRNWKQTEVRGVYEALSRREMRNTEAARNPGGRERRDLKRAARAARC